MFVCFFFKPPLKYRTESRWLERSVVGDRGKESRTSVVDRGKQQQEGSVLTKIKPSDMLFKPISASICKSRQGTLGGGCNSLSPSLLSFIPPSSISLSSDLASGFCPHVCYLIPLLDSFHLMIFSHLSPSKCQSFSLATGHDPSLFMSLPVYRWVRVSLSCPSICLSVRPSFRPCTRRSESVRQLGWGGGKQVRGGPHFLRGCWFSTCVELSISVKPCGVEQEPAPIFCGCLNCIRMSRIFLWAHCRRKTESS